jgi:hypothetical protein
MKAGNKKRNNKKGMIYEIQLDSQTKNADKKTTTFCTDAPNGWFHLPP